MENVVLVIHLMLALAIIILVLLQRSEGGGLGIGGSGGGMGGLATARQTANVLTRATAICAACFFATSLILAIMAGGSSSGSILDEADKAAATAPSQDLLEEVKQETKPEEPAKEAPLAPVSTE